MNSKGLFINNNTFISKRKNKGLIKAKIYLFLAMSQQTVDK